MILNSEKTLRFCCYQKNWEMVVCYDTPPANPLPHPYPATPGPVRVATPSAVHAAPATLAAIQARPTGHADGQECLLCSTGIIPGTATAHRAVQIVRQIAAIDRRLRQITEVNNFTQYT